jgi:hypothetical protein
MRSVTDGYLNPNGACRLSGRKREERNRERRGEKMGEMEIRRKKNSQEEKTIQEQPFNNCFVLFGPKNNLAPLRRDFQAAGGVDKIEGSGLTLNEMKTEKKIRMRIMRLKGC